MNKIETFQKEYQYIKSAKYKENIKILVDLLPDYFFEVPASSTGKYHPSFALGDGGLVRHTKVAVKMAYELLQNECIGNVFEDHEKDMIIMALLLHDGLKSGLKKSEFTAFDNFLTMLIESHMGPWNTNSYSDVVLPKPNNKYQKFVHMCDFLASRKFLDVKFENNDIIE